VKEPPLALVVGLDHVEPRQLAGQPQHALRPYPLRRPTGDHLVAEAIVAERGDVVGAGAEAGEIDGGIERIAAIAA
jgi:hypothetical protein